jgi:hypothetical protein
VREEEEVEEIDINIEVLVEAKKALKVRELKDMVVDFTETSLIITISLMKRENIIIKSLIMMKKVKNTRLRRKMRTSLAADSKLSKREVKERKIIQFHSQNQEDQELLEEL